MLEGIFNNEKRKRIIALDLLRGFFLFVIIVNHLQRFPNGFDLITGRGELWISAAEGFVVISGILIGYIYGPRIMKRTWDTIKQLLKRAALIYVCVLGLSFFFMTYSYIIAAIPNESLEFIVKYGDNLPALLFDSLTLLYVFGWGEFLSHYVIYLFFAPLILYALSKNKVFLVVIISIILWVIAFSPFEMRSRYDFTLSWQILFVGGTVFGYYLPQISNLLHKNIKRTNRVRIKHTLLITSLLIFLSSLYLTWGNRLLGAVVPALQPITGSLQSWWDAFFSHSGFAVLVDKTSLGPLRIIFGIIVFWSLFIILTDYQKRIPRGIQNFFRILGEKSLFVYGLQAVVVFFIGLYVSSPTSFKEIPILNTGVTLGALLFIYWVTKNTAHFRENARHVVRKLKS